MPPVSERQRRAMFAAKAGKSNLGIPQKVGAEFVKTDPGGKLPKSAPKHEGGGPVYTKGTGPVSANFARGGPVLNPSRSQFMKTPDVFRTDSGPGARQDYGGKTDPLAKETGDKSLKPVKPHT